MSFSFTIESQADPTYKDIVGALDLTDVRCVEETPRKTPWPPGVRHFYRHGISCRAVEVSREGRRFSVRLLACSAPEDYDLGLRFVEALARVCGTAARPEEGPDVSPETLRERFGEAWIAGQVRSSYEVLALLIEKEKDVSIDGARRKVCFGPRTLESLKAAGPPEQLPQRMLEFVRRVQVTEGCYDASIMEISSADGRSTIRAAVWGEGARYLFPPVDYLLVQPGRDPSQTIFVPFASLPEVAGRHFSWLDEKQPLVDALQGPDWQALVQRARGCAVDPLRMGGRKGCLGLWV